MNDRVLKSLFMAASLLPQMAQAETSFVADASSAPQNTVIFTRCAAATMPDKTKLVFGEWRSATEDATLVVRGAVSLVVYDFPNGKQYATMEDEKGVTAYRAGTDARPSIPRLTDEHHKIQAQLKNICDASNEAGGNDADNIGRLDIVTRQYFESYGKTFDKPAPEPHDPTPQTPAPHVRGAAMA